MNKKLIPCPVCADEYVEQYHPYGDTYAAERIAPECQHCDETGEVEVYECVECGAWMEAEEYDFDNKVCVYC